MIEIKTYKTNDSSNVLNKTLTETGDYEGVLNADFNVLRPVIRFRVNEPVTFNFAYIPVLKRYYFVESMRQDGNLCTVGLKVDTLYTYRDDIKKLTGTQTNGIDTDKFISSRETVYDTKTKNKFLWFPNSDILDGDGTITMVTLKGNK